MKISKNRQKINKKDFVKNLLASWYLILFGVGMFLIFGFFAVSLMVDTIRERIEISEKAPLYEVVEGTVESVTVKKYYTKRRAGAPPDLIPDRKYVAKIVYTDKNGTEHQLISSEVDRKLSEGKQVKIAYHPTDENDADIAYFDVLMSTYIPCYLNTFEWTYIFGFIFFLSVALGFGWLLCSLIKECAQEKYQKTPPKKLSRSQLRMRRNACTVLGCAFLPISIICHYRYLMGKEMVLLSELDVLLTEWYVIWKQIIIAFACYFPVMIFFLLRMIYEQRRLKAKID